MHWLPNPFSETFTYSVNPSFRLYCTSRIGKIIDNLRQSISFASSKIIVDLQSCGRDQNTSKLISYSTDICVLCLKFHAKLLTNAIRYDRAIICPTFSIIPGNILQCILDRAITQWSFPSNLPSSLVCLQMSQNQLISFMKFCMKFEATELKK